MIDKKLKIEISAIVESHKKSYLVNNSRHIDLIELENNLRNATPAASKLADELLIIIIKHIVEKDIEDSTEIAQFTRDHVADFLKWCIVGDRK